MKRVHLWLYLTGTLAPISGCTTAFETLPAPRERVRIFDQPYSSVWDRTQRIMQQKQAVPALIDPDTGVLQYALVDGTLVTIFIQSTGNSQTRVYVSRNRAAATRVSESAILDEIAAGLSSRPSE